MSDKHREREDAVFREEMTKQKESQSERDFLKDKSISGPNTPRPTDAYIDQSLGKSMNRMEQAQEAGLRADKRMGQEEAQANQQKAQERANRIQERKNRLERAKNLAEPLANTPKKGHGEFER